MRRGDPSPPRFLIDRSLGVALKDAIGERYDDVVTLRDLYGEQGAQEKADEDWIKELGDRLYLTKDDSIRRNPLIQKAMREARGRGFCLPNAHLSGEAMAERFLHNLNRIIERGRKPGPYMYGVYPDSLVMLWPDPQPLPDSKKQRRRQRR